MTPRYSAVASRPRTERVSGFDTWRQDPDNVDVQTRAFWDLMTSPLQDGRFEAEMAGLGDEEFRVLSLGASGGQYLVPADVTAQVAQAAAATSAIARLALTVTTATGEPLTLPAMTTIGAASWTPESNAYTLSDSVFSQVALSAFKSTCLIAVSEELVRDSAVPLDGLLAGIVGLRLGTLQGTAFAQGNGTTQPLGAVAASSPYTVTTAATGSTTLFKGADILAAYLALAPEYRATASWVFHPTDFGRLAFTLDSAGAAAFGSLNAAIPTLLGRPVYIDAGLPAPSASAKSAIFGDLARGYAVRRVESPGLQRLDEVRSDSGQVTYRAAERVDGRPSVPAAVVILQHSAT